MFRGWKFGWDQSLAVHWWDLILVPNRMTGVLSTASSSRLGGPLNTPIINVSSCSINFCCCPLIWCKYLTVSVDDAMQESMEQLEKSLNNPRGLREVLWSGEIAWTSDGDGNGENLREVWWSGVNAWTCDSDRIGENLCTFYFSKQTPTFVLKQFIVCAIVELELQNILVVHITSIQTLMPNLSGFIGMNCLKDSLPLNFIHGNIYDIHCMAS